MGFDQLLQAPIFFWSDTTVSQELLAQNISHKKYFTKYFQNNRDVQQAKTFDRLIHIYTAISQNILVKKMYHNIYFLEEI